MEKQENQLTSVKVDPTLFEEFKIGQVLKAAPQ